MKRKNTTRNALLTSIISMLLCVSMLVGATFAWFTDEVTSANNIIKSGNLDIELEYSHDGENWNTVKGSSALFDKNALWEPGYTEVVYLRLSNLGSLALRYDLGINIVSEIPGINAAGKAFRLSNFIDMAVISRSEDDVAFETREDAVAAANAQLDGDLELVSRAIINGYNKSGVMEAGVEDIYLALVVYMPTTVGNDANHNGKDIPEINLGINVFATQQISEEDSFGNDYDADAAPIINATYEWYVDGVDAGTFTINTASDLAGLANIVNGTATQSAVSSVATYSEEVTYVQDSFKGKTVTLGADIDLMNAVWSPIGNSTYKFEGTFDGNGKTVSNLYIPGYNSNVGFFGFTQNGEVKNLTVENAVVYGRLNVGVVAGTPYTSNYTNITVKGHVEVNGMSYVGGVAGKNAYGNWTNITLNVNDTSYVKANSVENASSYRTYVGGVIGFMGEGGHTVSNVTSNINVYGTTCDVGGIVGIAHYGNTFENVTCTGDVTITKALEAADAEEMGGIAGVWHNGGANVTLTNCKFTGTLSANITEGVDLSDNTVTGAAYSTTGIGKLIIDGKSTVVVANADALKTSMDNAKAGDVVYANGVTVEGTTGLNYPGVTVIGATFTNDSGYAVTGTVAGTYKDCTFESGEALRWCYTKEGETLVFENCVIKTNFRGIHFDAMNGDVIFRNCEINGFNAYSGTGTMIFENCTFGNDASNYNGLNIYTNTVLKDCTFNYVSGKTNFIDMEGTGKTLTIIDCTATLDSKAADIATFVGGSKLANNTVNIDDVQLVKTPIAVPTAPLEEDFLFPAGTNAVMYKDMAMTGDAQIVHEASAVLGLSNVTANVDHDLIVRKSSGAICIENCDITLTEGAKLISVGEGGDAYQVFLINVKINGELLTQENASQYLQGISWFGAYAEWPNT